MSEKALAALDRLEAQFDEIIAENKRYSMALGRVHTDLLFGETLKPETVKIVREALNYSTSQSSEDD